MRILLLAGKFLSFFLSAFLYAEVDNYDNFLYNKYYNNDRESQK